MHKQLPMLSIALVWLSIGTGAFPQDARAQAACPQGRAANGQCVNSLLADAAREAATIFAQPRISQTHYPLLPWDDWSNRYPGQLIGSPPQTSSSGSPAQLSRRTGP